MLFKLSLVFSLSLFSASQVIAANCASLATEYATFLKKHAAEIRKGRSKTYTPDPYYGDPAAKAEKLASAGSSMLDGSGESNIMDAIMSSKNPANKSLGYERLAELDKSRTLGLSADQLRKADPYFGQANHLRLAGESASNAGDAKRAAQLLTQAGDEFAKRGNFTESFRQYHAAGASDKAVTAFQKLPGTPNANYIDMVESLQQWRIDAYANGRRASEATQRAMAQQWEVLRAIAEDSQTSKTIAEARSYIDIAKKEARASASLLPK